MTACDERGFHGFSRCFYVFCFCYGPFSVGVKHGTPSWSALLNSKGQAHMREEEPKVDTFIFVNGRLRG